MSDVEPAVLQPQPEGIPLPRPGRLSAPYWDAARRGELVFQKCATCSALPRRPTKVCPDCAGRDLRWETSVGRGTLYSWTAVWRAQHPSFRTPYAPAVMAVEEGWWLMTSVIGCRPDDLTAGMALQVEFHRAGGDIFLPYARSAENP